MYTVLAEVWYILHSSAWHFFTCAVDAAAPQSLPIGKRVAYAVAGDSSSSHT